jgi:phenylacetate-coenzyme A ligase PaaK-like adenylate-forming protein
MLPMATGGSTSLPLSVYMNKYYAFSMLFTFFKCWRRMGWNLGDKVLVFYPKNTYLIDEMARFNRFSALSGFRIILFDKIDQPTMEGLIDVLNRYRPQLLLAFPSTMNMISQAVRNHKIPLRHRPPLINVSGETFFDCQRKNIQSVFTNSKIEDSYGSVELGEIAHETGEGLECFSNVAYVENRQTDAGLSELIITRLDLCAFPIIRYQMKDLANVELRTGNGNQQFVMSEIEGKDTNFILSKTSQRLYPSFFNRFVNFLNERFDDHLVEVKVYEREQRELEVLFITRTAHHQDLIEKAASDYLRENIGKDMRYKIRFVDFIDHDYRKKYRVIEREAEVEYAGGVVGTVKNLASIK